MKDTEMSDPNFVKCEGVDEGTYVDESRLEAGNYCTRISER